MRLGTIDTHNALCFDVAPMPISVLLADDAEVIRTAIRGLLKGEPSIEVCGEAVNFSQTIELAANLKPDIILLDLRMPDSDKFEPNSLALQLASTKVLAMSFLGDDEAKTLAESYGAVAMLDKAKLFDELVPAILDIGQSA